ncbi:MAG TPA: SDR family oxidoreductase [Atribacteraceae bacterium]|nr:SDR family oxidoreductase [Atribacteraceae bacterium]
MNSLAALITGGGRRLGKAMTLALAHKGYGIALHYHQREEEAKDTATGVHALSVDCRLYRGDLTNDQESGELMDQVMNDFPGLSLVVNNASLFEPASFLETDSRLFDRQFAIHLKAPFILTRNFARRARGGCIINILDAKIKGHRPTHMAYILAKKALAEFTLIAARDLAPRFRVNGVAPGPVEPPPGKDTSYLDRVAEKIPLKTRGYPEDIARAVVFLAENPFITGEILFVDGGESLS